MTKRRRFPRELETLSAYLDEKVSLKDRDQLKTRLRDDPGINSTLSELKQTRDVLRAAPHLRAPRNFTLTPEMAGIRSPGKVRVFPVFSAASAVASFLFVLILIGDILGWVGVERTLPMDQVAKEVVVVQEVALTPQLELFEAPAVESLAVESLEPEPVMEEGEIVAELEDQAEAAAEDVAEKSAREESLEAAPAVGEIEAPAGELMMAPEEERAAEGEGVITERNALPPEEEDSGEEAVPTITVLQASPVSTEPSTPTPDGIETDAGSGDVSWEAEQPIEPIEPIDREVEGQAEPETRISGIRILEIILGTLAISSGVAAWYFRRRG